MARRGYQAHGLHIELDGRLGHDRTRERWRDMDRDNASVITGQRVLRYGWADVVGRPCAEAAQVVLLLRHGGWNGIERRCPCCA